MLADSDLAAVASLLGDRRRAGILLALLGGEPLPARELGKRVGASSSLASAHLAKLLGGGLVTVQRRGRERYYGLAGPEIAQALEGLLAIAPARTATSLRDSRQGNAIRYARSCYDHLAGELGVGLTEALQRQRVITFEDGAYRLTPSGEQQLFALGVDVSAARERRRAFTGQCLDWTERRPHLAGALGAAIADRLFEQRWVQRLPHTRALRVTPTGADQLRARFALDFAELGLADPGGSSERLPIKRRSVTVRSGFRAYSGIIPAGVQPRRSYRRPQLAHYGAVGLVGQRVDVEQDGAGDLLLGWCRYRRAGANGAQRQSAALKRRSSCAQRRLRASSARARGFRPVRKAGCCG